MQTLYQVQGISSDHPYNLRNLGERTGIGGTRVRRTGEASRENRTRPTTIQDYDNEFIGRLVNFYPAYEVEEFLEYHFSKTDFKPELWLKHLEYEIITNKVFDKKETENFKKLIIGWVSKRKEDIGVTLNKEFNIGNKYNIKWQDDQTNLIELVYALIESGVIKYNKKKDVVNAFSEFFNFKIPNPNQTLNAIKRRNSDNPTILLDKLKDGFINYLNKDE
ncbi:RteC domain-containing protein [Adhaeribacter rhizoryzae]|uniref:Uncharacterized protein n=1 Tax=Adhaeribacter rhizoryzae TaxID=2607907 RepID=A0A5M6D4K8_9BACT|nr:RteC domain-containing protein [Adhaeribacter rhizoryzae]KAA5542421.1 hypothetical protein F0145_18395 [Adhaeribacter rhizoryzae]